MVLNIFKSYPITLIIYSMLIVSACKKKTQQTEVNNFTDKYSIKDSKIYNYANPIQLIGSNAFHIFSAGGSDMNSWNIDIAREFIGNVKEAPLTGNVILDANGAYLHPLQHVIDSNRKNNRLTIICAFGWDGTAATAFTGKSPAQTFWWANFKVKLQQWAIQFKNQQDVWIQIWNEPYRYDRADGYTDDTWLADMNEMVNIIRSTGNNNIIVVPCAEQGQDESVLINNGTNFLLGKKNILFDIHAYEKWLLTPNNSISARLQNLKQLKLPIIFGEVAPINAGILMNPQSFLDSAYNKGLSVCAWVWKYDSNDQDALLNNNGLPNNNNNNNWGNQFKALSTRPRKP